MVTVILRLVLTAALSGFGVLSYNQTRAVEYAKFAGAAYCPTQKIKSWNCGKKCSADVSNVTVCQGDHLLSFVAKWEGKGLLSFQGTNGPMSALVDLQFAKANVSHSCDGCLVHSGFLDEYNLMEKCIKKALNAMGSKTMIRSTGHSLGAAVSSIAMLDLVKEGRQVEEIYDFGKPRVGNSRFASFFDKTFEGKAWRVTHGYDPVPQLPPAELDFEHTYPEIYYLKDVSDSYVECMAHEDRTKTHCIEQYWHVTLDLPYIMDHLHYMDQLLGWRGCLSMVENSLV